MSRLLITSHSRPRLTPLLSPFSSAPPCPGRRTAQTQRGARLRRGRGRARPGRAGGRGAVERGNPARPFMWAVVALGMGTTLYSAGTLPLERLDLRFLLLGVLVCVSSHVAVRIPRVSGRITVSDTLIFLTLLLYGGAAAV